MLQIPHVSFGSERIGQFHSNASNIRVGLVHGKGTNVLPCGTIIATDAHCSYRRSISLNPYSNLKFAFFGDVAHSLFPERGYVSLDGIFVVRV